MNDISNLEPKIVWNFFDEICQVPRPSKKEEKIIKYLLDFGKKYNLETVQDEIGNVLIKKAATAGKEDLETLILQSHIDMVCEKNSDVEHDFENDPISTYIEDGWVKAKGTTLGADDGIGVAAQLAVLSSDNIEHPAIECLFTVDEETGLTGAFALQEGFLSGKTLINLDSEDDGELFIGCSGGIDTVISFEMKRRKINKNALSFKVSVNGLKGGHSGDEINKKLGNSNKILGRFLFLLSKEYPIYVSDFNGGNLRNAIPREAFATISIAKKWKGKLKKIFKKFEKDIKNEFSVSEPNVNFSLESIEMPESSVAKQLQKDFIFSLMTCPNGVVSMSQTMENLVETSTNLASVKFSEKEILIVTSQRSSLESAKENIANVVSSIFKNVGANVSNSDGYPGWEPNTDSKILKKTEDAYEKLFGEKPLIRAIHAGLECGLFLEKYPYMDMISFGPTINRAHSPDEELNIETTKKFWELLLEVLK